jgi:hypothetical protein
MRNNLLYIPSTTIDGRPGNFLFGSAAATSVLDPKFAPAAPTHTLQLNEKKSLKISAVNADLHSIADAIIGANAFGPVAVTIDYRAGLLTLQNEGIHPELMSTYHFQSEPAIDIDVDGKHMTAVVDTTSPDTLTLPGSNATRRIAHVSIAGHDFVNVDVKVGGTSVPRVGNRLLSKFLITIDYKKKIVGMWQDPR